MKKIFAYLTLGFTTLTTYAATPLWMRDIQISPDGTEIVFCYKGDIYKVSAKGGTATQLTTQESYESSPVWSPDGKQNSVCQRQARKFRRIRNAVRWSVRHNA